MKFLVDAQLPRKLATLLSKNGHEIIHTLCLPEGNRTKDEYLRRLAVAEGRIVVTKDADFVTSHLLLGSLAKLLQISTGNVLNPVFCALVLANLVRIDSAFMHESFIESTATSLIVHK